MPGNVSKMSLVCCLWRVLRAPDSAYRDAVDTGGKMAPGQGRGWWGELNVKVAEGTLPALVTVCAEARAYGKGRASGREPSRCTCWEKEGN